MRTTRFAFLLILLAALLLQACGPNPADAIATGIAQTLQISQLETAAAGGGNAQQPTAAPAEATAAGPTETPTLASTPTPSVPMVSVSENTNCRTGPNVNYGLVTTIQTSQQVEVLKTFNGANYVVVRNPAGSGDCWLWLQYASPVDFSAYNLPVATQPPTPTPTFTPTPAFDWTGAWNVKAVNGGSTYTGVLTFTKSGNTINGNITLNPGAYDYTFTATLNSNMQQATGTFGGFGSGDWAGQIKSGNLNQFIGNLDDGTSWEFCGWRSGSSEPAPCKWP